MGRKVSSDSGTEEGPGSRSPLLVVVSGPSGVGKDTVLASLLALEPRLRKVVTATTRRPRQGEAHARDHYFVSPDEFQYMIDRGELLEHARVYGNWYGVPKDQVTHLLNEGFDVLLRTDIQGAATIKRLAPEALLIFIAPTSMDELTSRLDNRGGAPEDNMDVRTRTAQQEMAAAKSFDYVVVNREGGLERAVAEIRDILAEERGRRPGRRVHIP